MVPNYTLVLKRILHNLLLLMKLEYKYLNQNLNMSLYHTINIIANSQFHMQNLLKISNLDLNKYSLRAYQLKHLIYKNQDYNKNIVIVHYYQYSKNFNLRIDYFKISSINMNSYYLYQAKCNIMVLNIQQLINYLQNQDIRIVNSRIFLLFN